MIPELIQPLLDEYILLVQQELPEFLIGFYLHGSIALGAFNERLSDIDFITVISRPATASDLDRLEQVHRRIAEKYPRWGLEGSYLQWDDLGKLDEALSPYPYYADGKFHASGHHGAESVTWWILKTHGLTILGPKAESLPFSVDWDLLITRMRDNLNTYWASYTTNPLRMASLLTDYGIQWAVLGVLRQYYTFEEHDITSKTGAGHYALAHLPAQWHRIVEEAINIREQTGGSLYKNKIGRAIEAVKFLKYIIALCNARQ